MMVVERCLHSDTPMGGPVDDVNPHDDHVVGSKVLGYKTRCSRCGAMVMVSDELTQRTPTQRYHKACYEDMLYRPPQEVRKT